MVVGVAGMLIALGSSLIFGVSWGYSFSPLFGLAILGMVGWGIGALGTNFIEHLWIENNKK